MKHSIRLLIILITLFQINSAMAGEDISGKWYGKFVPAPGSELTIHFIIKQDADGSYSVVLDSPDQGGIKNIEASSVVYSDGILKLEVPELSGAYEGVIKDNKIEGHWKQEGTSIPLNLKLSEDRTLTKEEIDMLLGQWHGKPVFPQGLMGNDSEHVFKFEMTKKGELKGALDRGGYGQWLPLSDFKVSDDSFTCTFSNNDKYKGTLGKNEIVGAIIVGGGRLTLPMTLKKGEYTPQVYSLNLPEETIKLLSGDWNGEIKMGQREMIIIFSFEKNKEGKFTGFYRDRTPVTEANLTDGRLTLKIQDANAEFTGQINGDELTGEWSQPGMSSTPLSLKRGKYIPPVYNLNLPEETKKILSGKWEGKSGSNTLTLRFEKTEKGEFVGSVDAQAQRIMVRGMPIREADLTDNKLTFKILPGDLDVNGELTDDGFSGEFILQGNKIPILLKKEDK